LQNLRNSNVPSFIEARVTDASSDFEYNVIISTIEYDGITWAKALATAEDVKIPVVNEHIVVNYLHKSFSWENINNYKVYGVTLNKLEGNAMATINTNLGDGTQGYLGSTSLGEDYTTEVTDITGVEIVIEDATDNFQYSLIIQVGVPSVVPSPRFEFDSSWNVGKIIFRWQNMDSRIPEQKLDYTSATYFDNRIDTNNFDNVKKYLVILFLYFNRAKPIYCLPHSLITPECFFNALFRLNPFAHIISINWCRSLPKMPRYACCFRMTYCNQYTFCHNQ